jgi:hypothetical protein
MKLRPQESLRSATILALVVKFWTVDLAPYRGRVNGEIGLQQGRVDATRQLIGARLFRANRFDHLLESDVNAIDGMPAFARARNEPVKDASPALPALPVKMLAKPDPNYFLTQGPRAVDSCEKQVVGDRI